MNYIDDPHYPKFHLAPESGCLDDPCGALWRRNKCHLFYQRDARWAHAVFSDLSNWRELSIAIEPTPGTGDQETLLAYRPDHGEASLRS